VAVRLLDEKEWVKEVKYAKFSDINDDLGAEKELVQ